MSAQNTATSDPAFLARLENWIQSTGEILVLIRYAYSGGAKSFEFFSSFRELASMIEGLPPRTSVIAFRQPQLPLRGVVTDDFIARCLAAVPDGSEYLVVEPNRRTYGSQSWFHFDSGESHGELRENLEGLRDSSVAAGLYPDWLYDNDDVTSAIVPTSSGVVEVGAY